MRIIKFFLLCLSVIVVNLNSGAQGLQQYRARWQKVDDLVQKKNLPRSALEEVKRIYNLAKKEGQDAQVVKALVYTAALREATREDNLPASIKELEQEIA